MSVNVSAWVWTLTLPPYEKMIMLELADHANTKGVCWPKQKTIAERTGIHRVTVNRILRKLEGSGLLTQEQRRRNGFQRSSMYRLSIGTVLYLSSAALPCDVAEDYSTELPSATHIETSIETSNETSLTAAPENQSDLIQKKETSVKHIVQPIAELMSSFGPKSKDEIFDRFKLTPKGCADLWINCHAAAGEHGKGILPSNSASKILKIAAERCGDEVDFRVVVWKVMHDWEGYGKMCESHAGAPGYPLNPQVNYFTKHIEVAVNFAKAVQLTAHPLTNKPVPSTYIPKAKKVKEPAITLSELLAMNEDDE